MKRNVKKVLKTLIALVLAAALVTGISATAAVKGKITVGSSGAKAGQTVSVTITMDINPGIATADFELEYDTDALTLTNVKDEGFITANDSQYAGPAHSDNFVSPYHLSWCNDIASSNITKIGKMVTLTFKVADNAQAGAYPIMIVSDSVEIYDYGTKPVDFEFVSGAVTVSTGSSFVVGDVNGDGEVSKADSMILKRYISGWEDYDKRIVNMDAADMDRDGVVKKADSMILTRYIAGWDNYDRYIITIS